MENIVYYVSCFTSNSWDISLKTTNGTLQVALEEKSRDHQSHCRIHSQETINVKTNYNGNQTNNWDI